MVTWAMRGGGRLERAEAGQRDRLTAMAASADADLVKPVVSKVLINLGAVMLSRAT
jgi:hypothetical protein